MAEIRKLGWLGTLIALTIFAAGFMAGGVFHHATMPTAISAAPPPIVTTLPTPTPVVELTRLTAEISELRGELVKMNAALQRIEVSLRRR